MKNRNLITTMRSSLINVKRILHYFLGVHCPKLLANILYFKTFKKFLNFKNPKDLNEKINWLLFNSDTSEWSRLSDKYRVREYIKECGLEDILIPLYGKWDDVDDICFDKLPNSFILKANNGSGTVLIVENKETQNINMIKDQLRKWINTPYGIFTAEPHYLNIKPCIIAEELLIQDQIVKTASIIDYKVFCFGGTPYNIRVFYNRNHDFVCVDSYDLEWNRHKEHSIYTNYYRYSELAIPKPSKFDYMINVAKILSKNFPQVRVDFYLVNNKLYFGEMTFTAAAGRLKSISKDFLLEMGNMVAIPK